MTDMAYRIVVRPLPADEGGGYVAVVPDLRGCMGDGDTPEAAVSDCIKAIEEWKDEALRVGRAIPEPGSQHAAACKEAEEILGHLDRQERIIEKQEAMIEAQKRLIEASEEAVAVVKVLAHRREPAMADRGHNFVIEWDLDEPPLARIPLLISQAARRSRELEN